MELNWLRRLRFALAVGRQSDDTPTPILVDSLGRVVASAVNVFANKGDLLVGTGGGNYAILQAPAVGGYVLTTDPTTLTGLMWVYSACPDGELDFSQDCNSIHLSTAM